MKNGLFTGWKDVFAFTFSQNTKTKTFKSALIGIGVLMFAIFFMINMITGFVKSEKKSSTKETNKIEQIWIINESEIPEGKFADFTDETNFMENVEIKEYKSSKADELISSMQKDDIVGIVIKLYQGKDTEDGKRQYMLDVYSVEGLARENVEKASGIIVNYFDSIKYTITSVKQESMNIILSDSNVYSKDVDEEDESIGETLAKIFIPMIFVLIIYMMVLMYGQSISKSLVVEKNSKLMEMLLISVKPYAIVAGKILAMYSIAILQMFIWAGMGIAGFLVGDKIAGEMFEKYENPIIDLISLMRDNSASAFSMSSIIVGIIALLAGFLLYCVFSGLIASNITKAEEIANGMSVYQMVVVVAFLAAYMLPLMQSESVAVKIIRYIPITSAFILPSDVIVGNIGIIGAIVSILITIVSIFAMIIATGKIYKKKVF